MPRIGLRNAIAALIGVPLVIVLVIMALPLQATRLTVFYDLALHVVVGAVGCIAIGTLMRHRMLVALAAAVAILAGWPVASALLRAPAAVAGNVETVPVRLLWANLQYDHLDAAAFARLQADARPDITAVTELPQEPFTLGLKAAWTGNRSALDTMISSDWPVSGVTVRHRGGRGLPVIAVDYTLPDAAGTLRVVGLHAPHTVGGWPVEMREQAIDAAIALVRDAPERGKVILTGDFNLTPWAPSFRRLLDEADLRTTTPRGLPVMTWPGWLLWAGIPIDHVLVGPAIGVRSLTRGPDIGSDHRPLIAELRVSRQVQIRLGSSSGANSTANPAAVATR